MMSYFPLILLILLIASALISVVDKFIFEKKRLAQLDPAIDLKKLSHKQRYKLLKPPLIGDYARSLFVVFLVVFVIRSFLVEPFRIPSGSMLPDLKIGDFILVNKFAYDVRLPVWHKILFDTGKPKRGDVVVFRYPVNPRIDFIKRVVGLPGDRISYVNHVLTINGQVMSQKVIAHEMSLPDSTTQAVTKLQENLSGVMHNIYRMPWRSSQNFYHVTVPKGEYFVMGDNRDNSEDSRYWGFVPAKDLIGKAFLVWFSWDANNHSVRWSRIGKEIN